MAGFNKKLLAAGIAFSSLASPALADTYSESDTNETGYYITIGGGYTQVWDSDFSDVLDGNYYSGDFELDGGYNLETGVGYDFGRIRSELTYQKSASHIRNMTASSCSGCDVNTTFEGDFVFQGFMISGYWDMPNGSRFTPYIGGGIGATEVAHKPIKIDDKPTGNRNAWTPNFQVKLGVSYWISSKIDLYGETSYSSTGTVDMENASFDPITNVAGQAGLRWKF